MTIRCAVLALVSAAVLGTPAIAQSDQQAQQLCENDVFRLCQSAIPNRNRIEACLRRHFHEVSRPCRQFMASYGRGHHRDGHYYSRRRHRYNSRSHRSWNDHSAPGDSWRYEDNGR